MMEQTTMLQLWIDDGCVDTSFSAPKFIEISKAALGTSSKKAAGGSLSLFV